jgi:NADH-quinone oxidoreductase subunit M
VAELPLPWLVTVLAIPAAIAVVGSFPVDAERLRRLAFGAACLVAAACFALPLVEPARLARGAIDPWDPLARLAGAPVLRIDVLRGHLVALAALLWVLAVGVTPRGALDRRGIRRTALGTLVTLATFLTGRADLVVLLWAASVVVLLRGLAAGGYTRAFRIAALYLGASTLLLAAGAFALSREGAVARATGIVAVLLAVMIRKGILPFHGWLPEAFEHGRVGPLVLFSAPQIGAYVTILLLVPRAPAGLLAAAGVLALATGVYGAVAALTQEDARRAFGYLFVSQSALVMAGLECISVEGLTGGLCLWLSSGLAFAALARSLVVLEARRGRLSLDRFNGGYERMPLLASSFLVTGLAATGFPGTLGFVGTDLLVGGTVAEHPRTGFLVLVATALAGIAVLRAYFALFCGRVDHGASLWLRPREVVLFAAISALLVAGGLAPWTVVDSRASAAAEILARREAGLAVAARDESTEETMQPVADGRGAPEP